MEDATGSKVSGLWFVVGVCAIGAALTFLLRYGEIGGRAAATATDLAAAPEPPP